MHRRCVLQSLAAAGAFAQQRRGLPPAEPFRAAEGPNNPNGEGIGIHPGRVAWVRDPAATTWDGVTGRWWDDASTDQNAVRLIPVAATTSRPGTRCSGTSMKSAGGDAAVSPAFAVRAQ